MSALFTALMEGETKESLAAMVCELREKAARTRITPEDLPAPDTIVDHGNGFYGPLMFHWLVEGQDPDLTAREFGFQCRWVEMEGDLDENDQIYVDYFEYHASASEILRRWQPSDHGEGWKLAGMHDSEDGPVALFLRPLPGREAAAPVSGTVRADGKLHREFPRHRLESIVRPS